MTADAELTGGSQRVVPYSGAIARVNFNTLKGKAVLINLNAGNGVLPPMGADVLDSEGTLIGMVGQGGQIYARIPAASGSLLVRWGANAHQRCRVPYQLPADDEKQIITLNQRCEKE